MTDPNATAPLSENHQLRNELRAMTKALALLAIDTDAEAARSRAATRELASTRLQLEAALQALNGVRDDFEALHALLNRANVPVLPTLRERLAWLLEKVNLMYQRLGVLERAQTKPLTEPPSRSPGDTPPTTRTVTK